MTTPSDESLSNLQQGIEATRQDVAGLANRMDTIDHRIDRLLSSIEAVNQQLAHLSELLVTNANAQEQRSQAIDQKLDRIATSLEGHFSLANQQSQSIAALTNLASQLLARSG